MPPIQRQELLFLVLQALSIRFNPLNLFLTSTVCKKAKWLSEEALQIAVKTREKKGKGEKGRYTHLNAEFQRIARRDRTGFLSDQCKEIEDNNRMGKTRDLFKKIRDTTGPFHAKISTIKVNLIRSRRF